MSLADYPHIQAKIILDSICDRSGQHRLTTFELTYPRFIHAEIMTHRVLSRNAQSSRAIPAAKRIARIKENPVMPCRWGKNQKGMQPKDEDLEGDALLDAEALWIEAAKDAAYTAEGLVEAGLHKQWVNRLLEPFDTITTIITGTEWTNFFALRCHPSAQDEFQILAWKMADLYYEGPAPVIRGMHCPYLTGHVLMGLRDQDFYRYAMISSARCARVSYLNHDGSDPDETKDLALAEKLLTDRHLSPFEHVATSPEIPGYGGNLKGWTQFRKHLDKNVLTQPTFDYLTAKVKYRPW